MFHLTFHSLTEGVVALLYWFLHKIWDCVISELHLNICKDYRLFFLMISFAILFMNLGAMSPGRALLLHQLLSLACVHFLSACHACSIFFLHLSSYLSCKSSFYTNSVRLISTVRFCVMDYERNASSSCSW